MQLTRFSEYSLVILLFIYSSEHEKNSLEQIAKSIGISKQNVAKITTKLVEMKVLKSSSGRNGGISKLMSADKIKISEIVDIHSPIQKSRFKESKYLEQIIANSLESFEKELSKFTLEDILKSR